VLQYLQDKLVVVDWTATWCGPCIRIAPAFAEAARTNQDKCVFLKVDVDECQALAGEHGVSSMPTFSFFKHQSKVDSFSGADESKLHSTIDKHTKEPPSQYLHFPMRFDAMFSFKDIKFDLLLKNLIKFNGDMVNEVADMSAAPLSESELAEVTSLCTLLDDKAHYHQSSITAAQFQSLCKLLDWPIKTALPALNIWRVLSFHPGAAKLMSDAFDGTLRGKFASLCRKAHGNSNATMLLCRTLCNMFTRRSLALVLVQHMGDFMEPLAACTSSSDDNVRKSWACLALNFAVMFLNTQPPAGGSFEELKVQLVSGALELLNADGNSAETAYRTLQLIGTLVFRDAACQAVADSLDVSAQIDSMIAKFPAEAALQAAGAEVKQHVATGK
jgi:thioredoxin